MLLLVQRWVNPNQELVTEAVNDHLRVLYAEHPVEIESGGIHQVKPWFSGRLDFAPALNFSGDGDRQVRIGQADERERLARGHGGGALAPEQDGVPAAVEQRGLEAVAARGAAAVHGPARRLEDVRDGGGVRFGDVREHDSE